MVSKLSSYDLGYIAGDLSIFPEAIDSYETLYFAKNNSETVLTQALNYGSDLIIAEDATAFPDKGVLRINLEDKYATFPEYVYYERKTNQTFSNLVRGFAGSRQTNWAVGAQIIGGVFADHHNSIKDAVIKIENTLGTVESPASGSLNNILKQQEIKFLSPKPLFRGYPLNGSAPLTVKFQNFSNIIANKFFWDFGDGGTSLEKNPTHTFISEGTFDIKLRVVTNLGAQGVVLKKSYITVSNNIPSLFLYATPSVGYSVLTANKLNIEPTVFNLVDQSGGDIIERFWVFEDGGNQSQTNPNIHYTTHTYQRPGTYTPTLLITLRGNQVNKIIVSNPVKVL
jgi:PKD repeat protein